MAIPSYDDLTPSIPDVSPGEVFASVADVLRRSGLGTRGSGFGARPSGPNGGFESPEPRVPSPEPRVSSGLYAALHGDSIERLVAIARDFSPRIERHPGGTVVVDVAGLQRLFGDARSIAEHLARAGAAHVAVAATQTAAILLARARRGVTVAAEDVAAALSHIPLAVLQQLIEERDETASASRGMARKTRRMPQTFDVLQRWGLTTIGEFAALPAGDLSARLGPAGIGHQKLARGVDARPLVPDPGIRRFLETFELEWPIDALEPLSFVFARLLDPLSAALEQADRGGVALHLRLRLTDRTTHTRTLALPAPMRDAKVLRTLLLLDLESHPPPAAVDIVTIEIDPAPGRVVQYSLLERPVPSPETLATLMARLGALVGESRCGSPQILDTHRPDGWAMAPLRPSGYEGQVSGPANPRTCGPTSALRATAGRPALRRFRPPTAVRVAVDAGRPARIAVDRRGMPGGRVEQSAGPWRTSGGWWHGERWNRDEWDVALDDGSVCRIFQDRDTGGWFVEAVYD